MASTAQALTSRERVALAVDHREPDRVPIDLGGMKATNINIGAYQRVRDLLGLPGPARVLDPKFMISDVQEDAVRRLHGDVLPVDVSTASALLAPASAWKPRRLFDGREALFPPGTRIAEDPDGSWVMLDAAGARTSFRMPRDGHYFDDIAFNAGGFSNRDAFGDRRAHRRRGQAREHGRRRTINLQRFCTARRLRAEEVRSCANPQHHNENDKKCASHSGHRPTLLGFCPRWPFP